jgi:2-polyprenyl-6-hydroxyphenyl methylase/3-demethylubiquinone-9 3-methyltransferase
VTLARLAPHRHEAEVAARFDLLERRFKSRLDADDVRLEALHECLAPVRGLEILDLGCGKGRFTAALAEEGARVIGLDRSAAMLAGAAATGFGRVRGSARRLPLAGEVFDAVIAVEVFEHLPAAAIDQVLGEVRRVLRPGGTLAIVDKNAGSWNDRRPWLPNLAVKWIDERRGRWMYPSRGAVRERWFWPDAFARRLGRFFSAVAVTHLLSQSEAGEPLFERWPRARLFTLWSARRPGGAGV